MKEYQKIESLYKFDSEIKRFRTEFYNPIVKYLLNCPWYATEKIDGTNISAVWNGHRFEFHGRTKNAEIPKAIQNVLNEKFNYDMELYFEQQFGQKEVIVFMEGYAGKIQGGIYHGSENLIGYDVMIDGRYLAKPVSLELIKNMGIDVVPLMEFDNLQECIDFVCEHKNSIIQPDVNMEGLVCCPAERIYDHMGNRIIVKIKNKDLAKLVTDEEAENLHNEKELKRG